MKKTIRYILIIFIVIMGVMLFPFNGVRASEIAESGKWGNCPWTLDDAGILTIYGGVGESYKSGSLTWLSYSDSIKKVVVGTADEKVIFPFNAERTFQGLNNVEKISFVNIDTSGTHGMSCLFLNCKKLTKIEGLNKFNTVNDNDMSAMFCNCEALEEVDLSSFNTEKVTHWSEQKKMFDNNTSLKKITFGEKFHFVHDELVIRGKDDVWRKEGTDGVICRGNELAPASMNGEITLTGTWVYDDSLYWGTCPVSINDGVMTIGAGTGMESEGYAPDFPWWENREKITKIYFEEGVIFPNSIDNLFWACSALKSIDFSNVDMHNVKNAEDLFMSCTDLKSVCLNSEVSGGALKPENVSNMFYYCTGLENITYGNFDLSEATNLSQMFNSCYRLTEIDLSGFTINNTADISGMFSYCNNLTTITLPPTGIKASSTSDLFRNCENLLRINNLDKLDASEATSLSYMFKDCKSLTTLDLSTLNAKAFTDYRYMFSGCENLISLDISSLDTSTIDVKANGRAMQISSFPTVYAYRMIGMFDECNRLDKVVVGAKTQLIGGPAYPQYKIDDPAGLPENTLDENHKYEWYVTEPGKPENSGWKHIYDDIPEESIEDPAYRIYRRTEDQTEPVIPDILSFAELQMTSSIPETMEYTGDVIYPDLENVRLTAKIDGQDVELVKDQDFTVEYYAYDNTIYDARINEYRVGTTHEVRFYGKGDYVGVYRAEFTIVESSKKNIENCVVTWPEDMTCVYTGEECKPKPISVTDGEKTLVENTDYEIKYYRNIDALQEKYSSDPPRVIILGKGEYAGNVNKTFSIKERDINDADINVTFNKSYTETGKQIKPAAADISVTFGGEELYYNYDWEIYDYGDNIEVCTKEEEKAYVEIKGTENFKGYRKVYFDIKAANRHTVTIIDEKQGNLQIKDVIDGTSIMQAISNTRYYDIYTMFNGYVQVDDCALITLANKPIDKYSNYAQLYDDSILKYFGTTYDAGKITSDMTLYAIYFKIIDKIEFSSTIPKCGVKTETSLNEYGNYDFETQTNKPVGSIPAGSNYMFDSDNYPDEEADHGSWHKKDEHLFPFIGTFAGGETYYSDYDLMAKFGYVFNKDLQIELTNGQLTNQSIFMIVSRYDKVYWPGSLLWVDTSEVADHDWDAGKITKQPTETEEGIKTFSCKGCKITKTETIPKLTPSEPEKKKGEDGTPYGKGASEEVVEAAIKAMISDNDPAGTTFGLLQARAAKVKKNAITLKWTKPAGAVKFNIYGNACGKKNKMQKLTTQTKNSLVVKKVLGKAVKKGTYYKFMIVALDKNNNVVSTSKIIHIATKGGKVGNYKGVKLKNIKKNKLSLKKGKSKSIKAISVKESKLKVKNHRKLSYESSDPTVATVNNKGKITAKGKGSCIVYFYSQSGTFAKIKVTVK